MSGQGNPTSQWRKFIRIDYFMSDHGRALDSAVPACHSSLKSF